VAAGPAGLGAARGEQRATVADGAEVTEPWDAMSAVLISGVPALLEEVRVMMAPVAPEYAEFLVGAGPWWSVPRKRPWSPSPEHAQRCLSGEPPPVRHRCRTPWCRRDEFDAHDAEAGVPVAILTLPGGGRSSPTTRSRAGGGGSTGAAVSAPEPNVARSSVDAHRSGHTLNLHPSVAAPIVDVTLRLLVEPPGKGSSIGVYASGGLAPRTDAGAPHRTARGVKRQ